MSAGCWQASSVLRHCCLHFCYLNQQAKENCDEKNTKTPESAPPDQALEDSSGRELSAPIHIVLISTGLDEEKYLYSPDWDGTGMEVRFGDISTGGACILWRFRSTPSGYVLGPYPILPVNSFLTYTTDNRIITQVRDEYDRNQTWRLHDAGKGLVFIRTLETSPRAVTVLSTSGDGAIGISHFNLGKNQEFRLVPLGSVVDQLSPPD